MSEMADPMAALRTLQPAIDTGGVILRPCARDKTMSIILDFAGDEPRTTYVILEARRAKCIVQFVHAYPVDGIPCLSIGYATMDDARGRGLASAAVVNAIDDMRAGLRKHGVERFYVEAIVSTSNEASKKVAERALGPAVQSGTDQFSGEPIVQFLKLVE
jgi:RimJ/RimL family protein N-acetyltransferase